jgi:hypothetical protein
MKDGAMQIAGVIEDLDPRERRRALRTQARARRRLAQGIKLCGAKTRQGRSGARPKRSSARRPKKALS